MADEREGATPSRPAPATKSKIQTAGRQANAAQPLNAASDRGGPERYPKVDQSDAVQGEARSFDPSADAPTPRQGAGDGTAPGGRHMGPGGDPAEGKR